MKHNLTVAILWLLTGLIIGMTVTHHQMEDDVRTVTKEVPKEIIVEKKCLPDRIKQPTYLHAEESLLDDAIDHKEEIQLPRIKNLTELQVTNLLLAKEIGEQFGLARTAMGIMYQESLAGLMPPVGDLQLPVGDRSYGLMQVRLGALTDAIRFNPKLGPYKTDEDMIVRLITDKAYNIRVGVSYFRWLQSRGLSWRESLTAYNRGYTTMKRMDNPNDWHYTSKIAGHITTGPVAELGNEDQE